MAAPDMKKFAGPNKDCRINAGMDTQDGYAFPHRLLRECALEILKWFRLESVEGTFSDGPGLVEDGLAKMVVSEDGLALLHERSLQA